MSGRKLVHPLAVVYCVHDDWWFLNESVSSFQAAGPVYVFVSRTAWHGPPGDWQKSKAVAERAGATVVTGDWASEAEHRAAALGHAASMGHTHALIPDGDEIIEPALLEFLSSVAKNDTADVVHVEWDTYWRTPEYVVRPREPFRPVMLVRLSGARHVHLRHFEGPRTLLASDGYGIVHHLSYCGPDERIRRKVSSWSHRDEVVPGWFEKVWLAWQRDKTLGDLHPTRPSSYRFVERIVTPDILRPVLGDPPGVEASCDRPEKWPKVSVCVPLYGGEDDIRACLQSLAAYQDLLHETIVVDDASPDGAAKVAKSFAGVTVVQNKKNLGFAASCNESYRRSSGDVVVFLNSDTVVPRAGLVALVEDLVSAGTIAAAGPVSNRVGHFQQRPATYTSLETLPLFAEDMAASGAPFVETDMLVGFCLAVKRAVLEEVGPFDESFGTGLFEDNDLCHRIRRAGYRLVVSQRAFVHHRGSASLERSGLDVQALLDLNRLKYEKKWRRDLESGFVPTLPGLTAGRIEYDHDKKPENVARRLRSKVAEADVSLCMIVKNEERVIAECLESVVPFFRETIVVDTGSTDATADIARRFGAQVYSHPWNDSFAEARNHSLSYAKGRWVFWMDADDTLPVQTAEAVLEAACSAPPNVHGFVVPVQFVDEGPGYGTRVDHVKLFRNLPGVKFEGRIHEQVLGSLRGHGGEIARIGACVLHSGYDTSEDGQSRKRERDWKLLELDIKERPGHPFVLFNLGMTAHYTGRHEEAADWLRQAIDKACEGESHVRKAYALLAASVRHLKGDGAAAAVLEEGLSAVGADPELHFLMGQALSGLDRLEAAVDHYDKSLASDPSAHFTSLDPGIMGFKSLHNSAGVLLDLGRYGEAKERYLKALAQAPAFLVSAFVLFDQAVQRKDVDCVQALLDHVRSIEGHSRNWCEMSRRKAGLLGGPEAAVVLFELAVRSDPGAHEPRLALAQAHFDLGRADVAFSLLEPLARHGIAEAAYLAGVCRIALGDTAGARRFTALAMAFAPGHAQTVEQLRSLNRSLGLPEDADVLQ